MNALEWAKDAWPWPGPGEIKQKAMVPDGSVRGFWRLVDRAGRSAVLMDHQGDLAQARAWVYFQGVLAARGVRVPRIYAREEGRGWVLVEDMGERLLHEQVLELGRDNQRILQAYEPALRALARLQAGGGEGVETSMCCEEPVLGPGQMIKREAGYFMRELVMGACGLSRGELPKGLGRALKEISWRAAAARPRVLIHRDFQSRNILVLEGGGVGVVDFQSARLGPAAYDLVSLVHDPYVDLPWAVRERLVQRYVEIAHEEGARSEGLVEGLGWVAMSRLMQALGAYAFLTRRRGRRFFAPYARPALEALGRIAGELGVGPVAELVEMLKEMDVERRLKELGK